MEKAKLSMTRTTMKRWLMVLCVLAGIAGCGRDSPEAQLRQRIDDMQAAVETQRPREFMDGVSEAFTGQDGMDRAALHNLLRMRALANARTGATIGPLDVRVEGENATVEFPLLLTGSSGRLLPEQAATYRVTTTWRQEGGEWRVYHARWKDRP
ncbi:MAG: nuclear transport factor 2 family protein [Pseudoxanthomonas mexicana]|nr:nuclear transport factor 2 family protein [Pseudoxanthomonas mexicana]